MNWNPPSLTSLETFLLILLGFGMPVFPTQAAVSLLQDAEFGAGFNSLNFELDYTSLLEKDVGFYFAQGNLSAGGSQSKSEDTTTGTVTTYRSQAFAGGIGFGYSSAWNLDFSGYSSKTPETTYAQVGSNLDLSFSHLFMTTSPDSDFAPRLTLGVGHGRANIEQNLSFKILNFSVHRNVELDQRKTSAYLSYTPLQWLKIKLAGTRYLYSRSKADLQTAFRNRFLNYYTSDLVSTIGGLPENAASLKVTFYLSPSWDLEVMAANTHFIVDDSTSRRTHLIISRTWEAWLTGIGISKYETFQDQDTSILFNLAYDF